MEKTQSSDEIAAQKEKLLVKAGNFDREITKLITQCRETVEARYPSGSLGGKVSNIRPEIESLDRYQAIYNGMKPEEHFQYFEMVYNRNRKNILGVLENDHWLKNGKVNIQFGEGIKNIEEKCAHIKIPLSSVYSIACQLQSKAEESLQGIDISFTEGVENKDIIRPTIILLHLMRIFYFLNDGIDKKEIGKIVTVIENRLQVPKKTVDADEAPQQGAQQSNGGGLTAVFNMATGLMKKMGIEPPPNIKPPSEGEMNNVINTIFASQATQEAIQTMFTSLKDCNDFGSAMQTVVKNVTDPKTIQTLQTTVAETAKVAQGQNPGKEEQIVKL